MRLALTEDGRRFVTADTDGREHIFAAALRAHVPVINMIRQFSLEEVE